jgi:DNA primase
MNQEQWLVLFEHMGFDQISINRDEIVANCPFCGNDKRNFQANYVKNAFHCWACDAKGRVVDLICEKLGVSRQYVEQYIKGTHIFPEEIDNIHSEVLALLKNLKQHRKIHGLHYKYKRLDRYWLGRGISEKVIRKFKLGFDPWYQRAVIPVVSNGKLVAVIGRAVNNSLRPKYYKILPETHWPKNNYLFAFDHVVDKHLSVIVTEGPVDTLKMHTLGFTNTVAILGSYLSNEQAKLITENFERVYFMLDNDKAGRENTIKSAEMLLGQIPVFEIKYLGKDPGDLSNKKQIKKVVPYIIS